MKKISFEDALILRIVKVARFFVRVLPPRATLWAARRIGSIVYLTSKRRDIAIRNLRAAFASEMSPRELRRIARESIQSLAMSAVELLQFPDIDESYVRQHIEVVGEEKLAPYRGKEQGLIFLTAHFGSWELLNVAGHLLGYPMAVLARVQKHPRSDGYLNSLRASKGAQVIRKGMPVREILRSLKKGGIVGMLSDQDGGRNGCFVPFFGRMSSCPSGVATFAMRSNAPIIPAFIFRKKRLHHRIEVEEPLLADPTLSPEENERKIMQRFSQILESKIRRAPGQWLWAHRRWKSTPDRTVLVLSDGKAGHLSQSAAVIEAIRQEREALGVSDYLHSKIIEVKFRSRAAAVCLKAATWMMRGRLPFRMFWLRAAVVPECYAQIVSSYADIVVSCGAALQAVNLIAAAENGARSVVLMRPLVPSARYGAVIVPKHDRVRPAPNVFQTDRALSGVGESRMREEASRLSRELALPAGAVRIGLLVGGDAGRFRFSATHFENVIGAIERYSRESGAVLLATTSRRTPAWADALMKEKFDSGRSSLLVIANESNRPGVVNGILGLADFILVSGESISMVSEAVASGKPVLVYLPAQETPLKRKHRDFLDRLNKEKRILMAGSDKIYDVMKNEIHPANESSTGEDADRQVLRAAARSVIG